jgi:hypothetical protein
MGHDYGPPYTDGLCSNAARMEMLKQEQREKEAYEKMQTEWKKEVDSFFAFNFPGIKTAKSLWIKKYQRIRHLAMRRLHNV